MKRILCALLVALLMLSTLTLVGCNKEAQTLKFGLGVYTNVSKADSATEDADGQGKVAITAAAVTVDADGKIVSCVLDTADITVKYTADGKAVANDSFKTKYEQGKDYNMVTYGGATKEWYEQADAFMALVAGKTLDEVKALVAEGNKGNDEVINAGCTIMINEFVLAIEKAVNNAADSAATSAHTLKLGVHTEQTCTDATEEKAGKNQVETTFFAAAVDADGKVVVASSDVAQVAFTFDAAGASTYDLNKAVQTKKEQGDNYGMVAYGGAAKEWYAQAAAFDAACVGKTASEIAGFVGADNYGNADLKAAGCTILVNGLVKAAQKIG
ncbi:MAG: hypothetical protein E7594_06085 [Ruminococcaceae bacterium]|nr:hypothetical protein [Oscillospiraceae bacterium]